MCRKLFAPGHHIWPVKLYMFHEYDRCLPSCSLGSIKRDLQREWDFSITGVVRAAGFGRERWRGVYVVCKKCLHDGGSCARCDDNVEVSPRRLGLAERQAAVRNLQAHTHYSFEIQAVNGVSPKSPSTPQYATVNITTNQAGEKFIFNSLINQ